MPNRRIFITMLQSIYEKNGKCRETTFSGLASGFMIPYTVSMTEAEYNALPQDEQKKLKLGACFQAGVLDENGHSCELLYKAYLVVLDADHPSKTLLEDIKKKYPGVKMIVYTTFRSREDSPRYRILVLLDRTVNKSEYEELCKEFAKTLNCEFDKQCFNLTQKLQLPRVLSDIEYHCYEWGDKPLEVDKILGLKASKPPEKAAETGTETVSYKYGYIDAYNDVYSVEATMEQLSDIYEPAGTKNRYKLIGSDSTAGVIIDPDKNIATSFHASDPACGHPCSSFDLYRIHRYGYLDKECRPDTKKSELPSFKAMTDYVKKDKKVKELLDKKRDELRPQIDAETKKIIEKLQTTRKGEPKNSTANAVTIVMEDPKLSGVLYDSFMQQFIITKPVPWDIKDAKYPHKFSDYDRKAMIGYISRIYQIETGTTVDNALAEITFRRSINPLQEYFKGLVWDGTKRIEELLIKYLGCENSEYVRTATKVTLVSAVKRMFEPGCKVDTVLVILGKQGCGKSTLISRLARGYFSDNIRCQDMTSKAAAEKLRGVFIAELSEMAGYSKADIEMVKSFITCQSDNYREPYARIVSEHPRANIFIGTSNRITGLLTDETGNRRFLPVYATDNHTDNSWDIDETVVDQIWAETYEMYKNGESTQMPVHLHAEVLKMQDDAVIEDDRAQLVDQYLNILLPEDWYDMSISERRDYINHEGRYVGCPYNGTLRRDYICAAEIGLELFKLEKVDLTLRLSKEIALMLRKLGWTDYPVNKGRKQIRGYGKPTVFCRPPDSTEKTVDEKDSAGDS